MAGELEGSDGSGGYVVQISSDSGSTYNTIAETTAHDISQTTEAVEITNKGSRSQKLLPSAGKISVSGSISGFINTGTYYLALRAAAIGTSAGSLVYLKFLEGSGGNDFEGTFVITNWQQSSPDKEAATYSCSFVSSGEVAYTIA